MIVSPIEHRRVSADEATVNAWRPGDFAAWVSDQVGEIGENVDGLYCATGTAGAYESMAFWAAAQERGVQFANPKGFPWTLASSPAGRVAQELGIRGPVVTLVGDAAAARAATEHAISDLRSGRTTLAMIVAFDRGPAGAELRAIVVDRDHAAHAVAVSEMPAGRAVAGLSAIAVESSS
jgi:hypothetical protein